MAECYIANAEISKPRDLGASPWKLSGLQPITVIFGKNGSGKSRLLRAWRDANPDLHHYIVPERTGDLTYQPDLLQQQLEGRLRRDQGQGNFISNYRRQIVARIQAYFAARGDVRQDQLPGDPGDLEARLTTLLPDFFVGLSGTKNPPYALNRASDGSLISGIELLSSGEAQILTVGLDILTVAAIWDIEGRTTRLMLVDEPDAHIHPDLQVRFADFLTGLADRYKLQVVVASHSTTLLAALGQFAKGDAGIIYLDRLKADYKCQQFDKYKKEMAACLGGNALMGPLFGVPLLLVEGDDDYRIWSQVPRHHVVSLAAIPTNGDEIFHHQKNLEMLFSSLREPNSAAAGFALLDGDKKAPTPSANNPQAQIKFIGLNCHECENLYLSDEVLADMGHNWSAASILIKSRASEFGAIAVSLAKADQWDRNKVDLKGLMTALADILDPKRLHWTIRVARVVGSRKPSGQLEAFLGKDVVSAFWT